MKKIIYYVTDHGQGHATRTVALIRNLEKFNFKFIVRNSNQVSFFEKSLPKTKIISGITDVGPTISENGISIDQQASIPKLDNWIKKLDKTSQNELEIIKKFKPSLIISDISAMPFLVAKKIHVPSIAISNFSWSEVLSNILKDQIKILDDIYENADLAIKLPLGTELRPFHNKKNVGFVGRAPTKSRKEIRDRLGIKDDELCVFIALDNYHHVLGTIDKKIKILTAGAKINSKNILKINTWVEGQNLVNASDLVICKCGYGLISECLTNEIPFLYLMDDQHLEQNAIHNELKKKGLKNKLTMEELNLLNINHEFINSLNPLKKQNIDTKKAVDIILEML